MEGFDSREDLEASDKIARHGLDVVGCKVKELPKALGTLGKLLELQGASIATPLL